MGNLYQLFSVVPNAYVLCLDCRPQESCQV